MVWSTCYTFCIYKFARVPLGLGNINLCHQSMIARLCKDIRICTLQFVHSTMIMLQGEKAVHASSKCTPSRPGNNHNNLPVVSTSCCACFCKWLWSLRAIRVNSLCKLSWCRNMQSVTRNMSSHTWVGHKLAAWPEPTHLENCEILNSEERMWTQNCIVCGRQNKSVNCVFFAPHARIWHLYGRM